MSGLPLILTGSEVAERLRISLGALVRMIERGEARPAGRLRGKTGAWLFTEAEADRLAAARRSELLAQMPGEAAAS